MFYKSFPFVGGAMRKRALWSVAMGGLILLSLYLLFHIPSTVLSTASSTPNVPNSHTESSSSSEPSSSSSSSHELLTDILNATLGFERIYVISLPSRTDRRDGLTLMSAVTGIQLDWIDGVDGDTIPDKALPYPASHEQFGPASIGSWRAHMDAIHAVVENNLSSALILEDDVDWDISIKQQLQDYAATTRALVQPLASNPKTFKDPTLHDATGYSGMPDDILFDNLPETVPPKVSPYGDDWDLLWLGHCGSHVPNTNDPGKAELSKQLPRGRVLHTNDKTVPRNKYLPFDEDDPRKEYGEHTRMTNHVLGSICSLGYAISQRGARHLLYELGVNKYEYGYDIMLKDVCEGVQGRARMNCMAVQPPLFNHHRPAGNAKFHSDISGHGDNIVDKPHSDLIRKSTRINLLKMIRGETDYEDEYAD